MENNTVTISKEEYENLIRTSCRVDFLEEMYMNRKYINDEELKMIFGFEERESEER